MSGLLEKQPRWLQGEPSLAFGHIGSLDREGLDALVESLKKLGPAQEWKKRSQKSRYAIFVALGRISKTRKEREIFFRYAECVAKEGPFPEDRGLTDQAEEWIRRGTWRSAPEWVDRETALAIAQSLGNHLPVRDQFFRAIGLMNESDTIAREDNGFLVSISGEFLKYWQERS
ncbi:MAG: hypothetical protein ABH814_00475 [bacterium]